MLHEFLFDKATDFFWKRRCLRNADTTDYWFVCKILVRILLYDVVRQMKKIDRIII